MNKEEIDYDLLEVEKGNKRYGIYLKNHILDLQKEKSDLQQELNQKNKIIEEIKEYVNFLVIFNQNINGKFSETQWGEDILGIIEELEKGSEE